MMNKRCTYRTINLRSKLISIVEALTKRFYLIAATRQTNDIFCSIMFKVEHEFLLFYVVRNAHLFSILGQRYK